MLKVEGLGFRAWGWGLGFGVQAAVKITINVLSIILLALLVFLWLLLLLLKNDLGSLGRADITAVYCWNKTTQENVEGCLGVCRSQGPVLGLCCKGSKRHFSNVHPLV